MKKRSYVKKNSKTVNVTFDSGIRDKEIAAAKEKVDKLKPGDRIIFHGNNYQVTACAGKVVFMASNKRETFLNKVSIESALLEKRIKIF